MLYGRLDGFVSFYLRSTVQYVTFVTNQAEIKNRKKAFESSDLLGSENEKDDSYFTAQEQT